MDRPGALAWITGALVGSALLAAGVLKAARRQWLDDAAALRVPAALARPVPWVEIACGAALVAGVAYPWSAWVAAGLLAAFTAVLAASVLRGRHPVCACFGALSRRPVGWRSLARNVVLVGLAMVAAVSS